MGVAVRFSNKKTNQQPGEMMKGRREGITKSKMFFLKRNGGLYFSIVRTYEAEVSSFDIPQSI